MGALLVLSLAFNVGLIVILLVHGGRAVNRRDAFELAAAIDFALWQLPHLESRAFLRMLRACPDEDIERDFPAWAAYRDSYIAAALDTAA